MKTLMIKIGNYFKKQDLSYPDLLVLSVVILIISVVGLALLYLIFKLTILFPITAIVFYSGVISACSCLYLANSNETKNRHENDTKKGVDNDRNVG